MARSTCMAPKVRGTKTKARPTISHKPYNLLMRPVSVDKNFDGPFRSNVTELLSMNGRIVSPPVSALDVTNFSHLTVWRVLIHLGGESRIDLCVVEEDVSQLVSPYCDQCQIVGWGGNPVCRKRFHFIIQNDSNPSSTSHGICPSCGNSLHPSNLSCNVCKYEDITNDKHSHQTYPRLNNSTHLMHGLVHSNGYGHLLRVNGKQGGSNSLTGCDIMNFWDRLCRMLRARKISVVDISKKYGMPYRLLHAITNGHPWYGNWGYQFGSGSYGITSEEYQDAVQNLASIPLSLFFFHSRSPRTSLHNTISFYRSLSKNPLSTLKDLFSYVTQLLHGEKLSQEVLCDWTKEDAYRAEEVMIRVLRSVGRSRWVDRRAIKGVVCQAVKSSALLDYCLRELGGRIVDDDTNVQIQCNPQTKCIEYRLQSPLEQPSTIEDPRKPSSDNLRRDLKFLFDTLINPTTMLKYHPKPRRESAHFSALKLLDCKKFIKHYDKYPADALRLHISCNVELMDEQPPELLVLPVTATVADLKTEATKAFRETYVTYSKFRIESIVNFEGISDSTPLKLLLGSTASVTIRGMCGGDGRKYEVFERERGMEKWTVDCVCGAEDDDGERMLACDSCCLWQHTRCNGIGDLDKVPRSFVCTKCVMLMDGCDRERRYERTDSLTQNCEAEANGKHEDSQWQKCEVELGKVNSKIHGSGCKEEIVSFFDAEDSCMSVITVE